MQELKIKINSDIYGYKKENQKVEAEYFRNKVGGGIIGTFRNASIKMQFLILPPATKIPSSQSRLLLSHCFSFYSLNNRTAASGRRRGVTSKRPFRKMQMHVPLTRPRTMHHPLAPPPIVIKRARRDNLYVPKKLMHYLLVPPALRVPSLMRTRAVLHLSTLIRYFNRGREERGTFRVARSKLSVEKCTERQLSSKIYAQRISIKFSNKRITIVTKKSKDNLKPKIIYQFTSYFHE